MTRIYDEMPEGYRYATPEEEDATNGDLIEGVVLVRKPEHGPDACDVAVPNTPGTRLGAIRSAIRGECISYGEIAELQGLHAEGYVSPDDWELMTWCGDPEDQAPRKELLTADEADEVLRDVRDQSGDYLASVESLVAAYQMLLTDYVR